MAGYVAQADLPPSDESQEEFSGDEADYLERLKCMKWIEPRYTLSLEQSWLISSDCPGVGLIFDQKLLCFTGPQFLTQLFHKDVASKMSTQAKNHRSLTSSIVQIQKNMNIISYFTNYGFAKITLW